MSKVIWKFPVEVTDEFTVLMPEASEVLSVAVQGDEPQMWALVDLTTPMKNRTFLVVGTGNPAPENAGRFVGTWQGGPFVWHLFEAARVNARSTTV